MAVCKQAKISYLFTLSKTQLLSMNCAFALCFICVCGLLAVIVEASHDILSFDMHELLRSSLSHHFTSATMQGKLIRSFNSYTIKTLNSVYICD
jgi:hypothetical protein